VKNVEERGVEGPQGVIGASLPRMNGANRHGIRRRDRASCARGDNKNKICSDRPKLITPTHFISISSSCTRGNVAKKESRTWEKVDTCPRG